MQNNIAFDMDGVLVHIIPAIQKHLTLMYGDEGKLADNTKFKMTTVGGHSNNKIWKAIHSAYRDTQAMPAVHGAKGLLTAIQRLTGEPIKVVTARPMSVTKETLATLKHVFGDIEFRVAFSNNGNKIDHLGGIKFFVEDRRKNAIEISAAGKIVFLLDRPHNQLDDKLNNSKYENILRIYDMSYLTIHCTSFVRGDD